MMLYEITRLDVPLTTDKYRLARHAQRVVALLERWGAEQARLHVVERREQAAIVPLGIAVSWWCDLRILPDSKWTTLAQRVWPGADDPRREFTRVVTADVPRFHPEDGGRCPLRGSRGGQCNEPGRNPARWVTDTTTGKWEYRQVCNLHLPLVEQRYADALTPPPNRGGVLLDVFPELGIPKVYAAMVPGWKMPGKPRPASLAGRPAFEVIEGEAT